jgi:large subunit ribosomal protein L23
MKLAEVLIKPIVTEKSNKLMDKSRIYAFRVNKRANKLEVKKAVESFYGVSVVDVHTIVVPGKSKSRFTKAGFITGMKSPYKKAYVTIAEGDTIDLYGSI